MSLYWSPPAELSSEEEWLLSHCKKAKLFVFLRQHRHELFNDSASWGKRTQKGRLARHRFHLHCWQW